MRIIILPQIGTMLQYTRHSLGGALTPRSQTDGVFISLESIKL